VFAGERAVGPHARAVLDVVAVPLLAALIVIQTLDGGERIVVDARCGGAVASAT
jgi:hypothetical protein